MEKVKITKKQLEAIERLEEHFNHDYNQFLARHIKVFVTDQYTLRRGVWKEENEILNSLSVSQMSLILFFDHYEVELTKEEKLLDFYNSYIDKENMFDSGIRLGVETALAIYRIEIEGINK